MLGGCKDILGAPTPPTTPPGLALSRSFLLFHFCWFFFYLSFKLHLYSSKESHKNCKESPRIPTQPFGNQSGQIAEIGAAVRCQWKTAAPVPLARCGQTVPPTVGNLQFIFRVEKEKPLIAQWDILATSSNWVHMAETVIKNVKKNKKIHKP